MRDCNVYEIEKSTGSQLWQLKLSSYHWVTMTKEEFWYEVFVNILRNKVCTTSRAKDIGFILLVPESDMAARALSLK